MLACCDAAIAASSAMLDGWLHRTGVCVNHGTRPFAVFCFLVLARIQDFLQGPITALSPDSCDRGSTPSRRVPDNATSHVESAAPLTKSEVTQLFSAALEVGV